MAPFSCHFIILLICYHTYSSYAQYEQCPINPLKNGKVKLKNDGRRVEFLCDNSYVLVGDKYAVCTFGNWTATPPICAKRNCPPIPQIEYGKTTTAYRGAVSHFECDSGFVLRGSSTLVCFENGWNGSIPFCQVESIPYGRMCNFNGGSDQFPCNWKMDPPGPRSRFDSHRARWLVKSTSPGHQPSFDHTLEPHTGGYYLYLQRGSMSNDERMYNPPARYISPTIPAIPTDEKWCLIFWLYSNNERTSMVRVRVNDETRWDTTNESNSNRWRQVIVSLRGQTTPFRITIEGRFSRATGVSDTAIDDLYFTNGTSCDDTADDPYTVEPVNYSDEYDNNEKAPSTATTNSTKASHPTTAVEHQTIGVNHTVVLMPHDSIHQDKTKVSDTAPTDLPKSSHLTTTTSPTTAVDEDKTLTTTEHHGLSTYVETGDSSLNTTKRQAQVQEKSHSPFHIMGTAVILAILSTVAAATIYLLWKQRGVTYLTMEQHNRVDCVSQSELLSLEDVTVEPNET